jgi:TPR repeat protein
MMGNWKAKGLLTTLTQGVRGALLMRIAPEKIDATWGQLFGLAALDVVVEFATDILRAGAHGELALWALPGVLFCIPVILFASWAVAVRAKRPEQVLPFAIVLVSIGLVINAGAPLAHWIFHTRLKLGGGPNWYALDYFIAPFWFALASGVAAIRLFGLSSRQKAASFLLAAILIGVPSSLVYTDKTLWTPLFDQQAYEERQSKHNVLENEDIFYLQPGLLERELASLQPGGKAGIDMYFVGVAGYSDQDVFMKEIHYVSGLFKRRYGAKDHSVELINNLQTVAEVPIASVTSLQLSLDRIGKVMDKNKDILFLYLTSHGSRDHRFSLDFGGMRFNVLDPFRLREILDESGIKRRVVVVSACYSGGFIDALKDDNTLVITSAAPDRTSFGCSNEADFTYFGKAYFHDALSKTNSFIDAFNLAKPLITEREDKDHFDHSDPRMYVGTRIQDALAQFNRQHASDRIAATSGQSTVKTGREGGGIDVALVQQQALRGLDGAQFELGAMYQFGRGVKQNQPLAVEWYQKSAAQGNAKAMCNLGWAYQNGKGVKQDYAKALYLYQKAATLGDAAAQYSLGIMYQYGQGIPRDDAKAFEYIEKSALQGNAQGQMYLGDLYQVGEGVKQDDTKALEWYQKSAAQGNAQAYNEMGYMLLEHHERIPEAIAYLEKAIRIAPNDFNIMDSLGWGYYLIGKTAEGARLLRQAYAGHRDPVIAAHLGEVLWVEGKKQEGKKIWHQALKMYPQDKTLKAAIRKFIT